LSSKLDISFEELVVIVDVLGLALGLSHYAKKIQLEIEDRRRLESACLHN
jgi:hypothetical protein